MIAEAQMGFEADLAARIALDHRFPNLEGLFVFAEFKAGVASLQEFTGSAVLDNGASLSSFWRLGEKRDGEKEREEETGSCFEHVFQAKSSRMGVASFGTRRIGRPWGV